MTRLTDTQLVILSAAAPRDNKAVHPLPSSLTLNKGAVASVLKGLVRKGLIEERRAAGRNEIWREGDDGAPIALAITDAGLEAIGVAPDDTTGDAETVVAPALGKARRGKVNAPAKAGVRPGTKQALLIALRKRKGGATIEDAVAATGWQPHSVRGAISGTLKKKLALDVTSEKAEERGRVYRIVGQD